MSGSVRARPAFLWGFASLVAILGALVILPDAWGAIAGYLVVGFVPGSLRLARVLGDHPAILVAVLAGAAACTMAVRRGSLRWLPQALPWPQAAALVGLALTLCLAGIALICVIHQTAWVASGREAIVTDRGMLMLEARLFQIEQQYDMRQAQVRRAAMLVHGSSFIDRPGGGYGLHRDGLFILLLVGQREPRRVTKEAFLAYIAGGPPPQGSH